MFGVALFVRVLHVLQLARAPFFTHLLGDARGYDTWAQRLAAGDWLGSGVFYQAPLYPYLLGALYALFGRDLLVVHLVQAVVGALACALLVVAGAKWFGKGAGFLSGLILALYAPALFFDGLIQKSVLDGLLVSALFLTLPRTREEASRWRCLGTGIILGLLALSRENTLVLLPLAALWVWHVGGERRKAAVLLIVSAVAVVLGPVAVRNWIVGGEMHLTTSQLGPNFYIGNNAGATGTYMPLRHDRGSVEFEREDATQLAEAAAGRTLRASEVSRYWLDKGLDWISEHPADWLGLTGRKVLLLVNRTEAADTEDIATHAEWSFVLHALAPFMNFGLLAPLSAVGVWLTRRRWRELWPLYGFCGLFAVSVLTFFVLDRYRYPLVPVLALFAGAAVAECGRYWQQSSAQERAGVLGVLVAAVIVGTWPMVSATDMHALTHYNMGATLHADGLDSQAESEYRTALRLQPGLASAHANLGAILTSKGELSEAQAHCEEAVRLDPQSPTAHVNLGVVLASTDRINEAVEAFGRGLQLDPRDAGGHYNLGRALADLGQLEPAIDHLREAVRLDPARAAAYNNLGILLCSRGELDQGIAQFKAALRLDPAYREAAANLQHARDLARSGR